MNDREILEKLNDQRTRCTIWQRVMGYLCPVERYNKGKQGEFKEREFFVESKLHTKQ